MGIHLLGPLGGVHRFIIYSPKSTQFKANLGNLQRLGLGVRAQGYLLAYACFAWTQSPAQPTNRQTKQNKSPARTHKDTGHGTAGVTQQTWNRVTPGQACLQAGPWLGSENLSQNGEGTVSV